MGIRRKTAELTLDARGWGEEDLSVYPITLSRWTGLWAVTCRTTDPKPYDVTVFAVDVDDDDEEQYGDILFHAHQPGDGETFYPRVDGVNQDGEALDTNAELVRIKTSQIRVMVTGGTASAETAVDVYFQTSGDQRF